MRGNAAASIDIELTLLHFWLCMCEYDHTSVRKDEITPSYDLVWLDGRILELVLWAMGFDV